MSRQASQVAKESRSSSQKYYRLGPRFEKQLNSMVDQEIQALVGHREDIPMELNQEVLINLNYFLNDARGFMTRSLNRGQKYIPIMKAILRQKGLPEELVYLALIESGYRTEAVSHASAVGPWQFIAPTGRRYGLTINEWVDERVDPIKSTYAAADYLLALYEMFNSWPLAIAAYNSGEGKIMKGMRKPDVDNYWDMAKEDGFLAAETKRYVPSFIAAAIIAKDPLAYGLEVESSQVDSWDEVVVPQPIDLAMAAQLSGASLERIKELNPHLKKMATPPSETDFILRVPLGASEGFYQLYAQLPEAQRSSRVVIHLAKRGETVESVAQRYQLTPEVVQQYNNLTASRLRVGQTLVLPASMSQTPGTQESLPVATATTTTTSPRIVRTASLPVTTVRAPKSDVASQPKTTVIPVLRATVRKSSEPIIATVRHRVRAGDTLGNLARHYGSTVDKLKADNRLSSNEIKEGQVLVVSSNLPVQASTLPRSKTTWVEETEGEPVYYVVKSGETLSVIASKNNTTSDRLRTLNSLANSNIKAGQKLVIGSRPVTKTAKTSPDKTADSAPRSASAVHVVSSGDTVSQIAERYRMTSAELRSLNKLKGDKIVQGQKLRVLAEAQVSPAVSRSSSGAQYYEVAPGDTVSQIAERHNLTSAELRELNNLQGNQIHPGQKLQVAAKAGSSPAQASAQASSRPIEPARTPAQAAGFYEVAPGDTVSQIAERHQMTSAELRELNNLEGNQIHPGQKLQVASKAGSSPAQGSAQASAQASSRPIEPARTPAPAAGTYEVAPGDTVSQIAERHQMTSAELRSLNNLSSDQIRVGQKLKVVASMAGSGPAQASPAQATSRPIEPAKTPAAGIYEVAPGDTVSQIAAKHNMTSDQLRELNNLTGNQIRSGQKLKVVASKAPAQASPAQASSRPVEPAKTTAPATGFYEVGPGDTVSQIAERHQMTSAELRSLNNLSSDQIRVGQKLKVVGSIAGSSPAQARPAQTSSRAVEPAKAPAAGIYEVAPGDTVSQIAAKHNMTSEQLRELNNLTGNQIRSGQKLKVAGPASQAKPAQAAPVSQAKPVQAAPVSPAAVESSGEIYVVEAGDSLESVAAYYKTTPAKLRSLNNLTSDTLPSGLKLKIPAKSKSSASQASPSGSYKVKAGDTIFTIARAHNLTVDQLKKLNGKNNDNIQPGQTLKVK
jgi:membrane-bound lytic murein transglycosylase D